MNPQCQASSLTRTSEVFNFFAACCSRIATNPHAQTDYPEIAGKNATARQVNQLLASQAKARSYTYLDLATKVATASGDLDERYAQPDGVHLNDAGYALWMQLTLTPPSGSPPDSSKPPSPPEN